MKKKTFIKTPRSGTGHDSMNENLRYWIFINREDFRGDNISNILREKYYESERRKMGGKEKKDIRSINFLSTCLSMFYLRW